MQVIRKLFTLTAEHLERLDRIKVALGLGSRSATIRRLIEKHKAGK